MIKDISINDKCMYEGVEVEIVKKVSDKEVYIRFCPGVIILAPLDKIKPI